MKIVFYSPHLALRGTEVTMYDFAHYNETILGNESVIVYNDNNPANHATVIEKFKTRFDKVYSLEGPDFNFAWQAQYTVPLLDKIIEDEKCDALYMQKFGKNDGVVSDKCKNLVLVASQICEPHGEVYAYISDWLARHVSDGKYPSVPSIVDLPEIEGDFRELLGIPESAIVYGRSGGMDTWNIPWASQIAIDIVNKREDIYFVFQNTPQFYMHPNIKYLPPTADMDFKVKFINTCDAMLHARIEGESFGLSCAEFSLKNKPVITWAGSNDRNHIETLGEKGIYYMNPQELYNILTAFKRQPEKDWNAYKHFNPQDVMKIFDEVFLK
jgi:hypothetical protein